MNKNYARDLFQVQSELIDTKVEIAVSKSIDRVIEQIIDLKGQMNTQFSHLDTRISELEHRVDINEKALNSINSLLTELRSKIITYVFRGGWVILAGITLLLLSQASQLLHICFK